MDVTVRFDGKVDLDVGIFGDYGGDLVDVVCLVQIYAIRIDLELAV